MLIAVIIFNRVLIVF